LTAFFFFFSFFLLCFWLNDAAEDELIEANPATGK
jgi:hypothetical protein